MPVARKVWQPILRRDAGRGRAALDHPVGILLPSGALVSVAGLAARRCGTAGLCRRRRCRRRRCIRRDRLSSLWWHGISWPLPPFSCSRTQPALAVREVVLDLHRDDGADAGEGVGHDADQRAVAQADQRVGVDASSSARASSAFSTGVLPRLARRISGRAPHAPG